MKALETREQEKSVDAVECNPGLLFRIRRSEKSDLVDDGINELAGYD